jgi:hypothetical protein
MIERTGARGAGALLGLTHTKLSPTPVAEHHREGWERYRRATARTSESGDPGPDSPEMEASGTARD